MTNAETMPEYVYTVYNRKTDELILFDLPSRQAAQIMGVSLATFRNYVCTDRPTYVIIKTRYADVLRDMYS